MNWGEFNRTGGRLDASQKNTPFVASNKKYLLDKRDGLLYRVGKEKEYDVLVTYKMKKGTYDILAKNSENDNKKALNLHRVLAK